LRLPVTAVPCLPQYLEMLRSHQNRPAKCLTILWALGQAGLADLHEGLKVWLGVMLPVLGIKALSSYAVAYLDRLLTMHPNLTKGFGMIRPKDFFPLLDFAFMPNNSLPPSPQEQLRRLYPRLKVLSCPPGMKKEVRGGVGSTGPPGWVQGGRLRQQVWGQGTACAMCPPKGHPGGDSLLCSAQILTSMSQCLSLDPLSFSVWRQLYTKHLSQSSLLLNHLLESWDSSSRKVGPALQETVRSFKVTNEELAARGPGGDQDVAACDAACKELLRRMRGRGFPWSRLLLALLIFTTGFVLHDVWTHGSFQASSSAHLLRATGMLPAWQRLSHSCLRGYRWLERSIPVYGSQAVAVLRPQLEQLWVKGSEVARDVSEWCCSLLCWAHAGLPWLAEWLQSWLPESLWYWAECARELPLFLLRSCLVPLLEGLAAALEWGWQRCQDSCSGEVSWGCVREHLSSFTSSSWTYLHNTTAAVTNWTLAAISGH
ncbi:T214B protein, partial [Aegotheles bennettii]|nr:T214B protein [Aegotheles bennettii]